MNKEIEIQQLVSYITGNTSKKESEAVEYWISCSKENKLLYDEYSKVWNSTSVKTDSFVIDLNSRWNDFKAKTDFDKHVAAKSTSKFSKVVYTFSRVAAAIAVLLTAWFIINHEKEANIINYTVPVAQCNTPYSLPDGTEVNLNKDAEIIYPEFFANNTRELSFDGEAYFNIAHNPDKPMIIATGNIRVKVLGTAFNLSNQPSSNEITLFLDEGRVLFYSVNDNDELLEQVILTPGELGVYNKTTGLISKSSFNNDNHLAWRTGELEFFDAPLSDVFKAIERTYCVNVSSEDINTQDLRLTARFTNETPQSIFETLEIIYGFNFKVDHDNIILY